MTDPVNIVVELKTPYSAGRSFSIPALADVVDLGARTRRVNKESWKAAAKLYGIADTDPLYLATAALYADHRNIKRVPEWTVWIARDTPVAQVWTFTVGGNTAGDYKLKVDGTAVATVTANGIISAATIRTNLVTAFNAGTSPQTAAPGADPTGTLTADEPGVSFLVEVESPGNVMTVAVTGPNTGIAQDMDAATGVGGDDSFYIWTDVTQSPGVILNGAAWTQSAARRLLHFGQSNAADIKADVDTDVMSKIKTLGYGRTSGWYHPTNSEYLVAGILGRCIAQPVGQINWAHRQVSTVTPYKYGLDAGVADILEDKNVNRYDAIELGATLYGTMADGLFIDQAILRDVLEAGLKTRALQAFQNEDLIEYTERGAQYLAGVFFSYGAELVNQGALVAGSVVVTTGSYDDIPDADKATRNWPLFVLSAKARGPMNRVRDLNVKIVL